MTHENTNHRDWFCRCGSKTHIENQYGYSHNAIWESTDQKGTTSGNLFGTDSPIGFLVDTTSESELESWKMKIFYKQKQIGEVYLPPNVDYYPTTQAWHGRTTKLIVKEMEDLHWLEEFID